MRELLSIFVADYVPLTNKGEEAIIRGIGDMLGVDASQVDIAVFDEVEEVTHHGNITSFPHTWVYPISTKKMGKFAYRRKLFWQLLKQTFGLSGRIGNLTKSRNPQHSEMREFFKKADIVIVGHDGVFCPETCAVLHSAKKAGKRVGILGSGVRIFNFPCVSILVSRLYRKAIEEADFATFRECQAYEYMKSIGCDPAKFQLEPDPAFVMQSAPAEQIRTLLEGKQWYKRARQEGKLVVAATVAQKGVLLARLFPQVHTAEERKRLHKEYLAAVYDKVIQERDVFVVFIPHSIEEGDRNDLKTAQDVSSLMKSSPESYHVMTDDLSARTFKGVFRECDFLIGQRAHSLIGSAAVATPYVALTTTNDSRTHDILGQMCGCEEQMVNMDTQDCASAATTIIRAIDRREEIRAHLQERMVQFKQRLEAVAAMVLGQDIQA